MTPRAHPGGDGIFLTTDDLALRWHTSPGAIHTLKHRGKAPKSVRIGKRDLYRRKDVEAFEAELERQ